MLNIMLIWENLYLIPSCHDYSGVETVGQGPLPPVFAEEEPGPQQTLYIEDYNIIIIISLNTKAVIQVHKDPLHEYHL